MTRDPATQTTSPQLFLVRPEIMHTIRAQQPDDEPIYRSSKRERGCWNVSRTVEQACAVTADVSEVTD